MKSIGKVGWQQYGQDSGLSWGDIHLGSSEAGEKIPVAPKVHHPIWTARLTHFLAKQCWQHGILKSVRTAVQ